MADTKISALTSATTPLAGTEVLPIVQGGATVKVANNDLRPKQIQSNATSGVLQVAGPAAASTRVMTTPNANFTVARTDAGQTFTGTQLMTGVLGIGTVSPAGSFTVSNSGAYGIEFDVTNQFITSYNRTTSAWSRIYTRASDYTFNIAGSNDAVKIDGSGNTTLGSGNLVIGTSGKGVSLPGGITWTSGSGSPEGVVTAPVGSLYSRSDGGLLTSLYVKESGSGNTGWVGK